MHTAVIYIFSFCVLSAMGLQVVDTPLNFKTLLLKRLPRHWLQYLNKFIETFLKKTNFETKNSLQKTYRGYLGALKHFKRRSQKVIPNFECQNSDTWPTATHPLSTMLFAGKVSCAIVLHRWRLVLADSLGLNISFAQLYLSANTFNKCYFATLFIASHNREFLFCGIHSYGRLYMQEKNTTIQLGMMYLVEYKLHLLIEIIDHNVVETLLYHNNQMWLLSLPSVGVKCSCYHLISAEKQNKPVVSAPLDASVHVYDGPGILSQQISPQKEILQLHFFASTFQCIVISTEHASVSYSTILNQNFVKVGLSANSTKTISSRSLCANTSFCLLNIFTEQNYFLKFSVNHFYMTEFDTPSSSCKYGGAVLFGYRSLENSICRTYTTFHQHKNLYSALHAVFFLLYFYTPYVTNFNASFTVSTTDCHPKFYELCGHHRFKIRAPNFGTGKTCYIIQTFYLSQYQPGKDTRFHHFLCRSRIQPAPVKEWGKLALYNVTGFLRTFSNRNLSTGLFVKL